MDPQTDEHYVGSRNDEGLLQYAHFVRERLAETGLFQDIVHVQTGSVLLGYRGRFTGVIPDMVLPTEHSASGLRGVGEQLFALKVPIPTNLLGEKGREKLRYFGEVSERIPRLANSLQGFRGRIARYLMEGRFSSSTLPDYFVQEWLDGPTLEQYVCSGPRLFDDVDPPEDDEPRRFALSGDALHSFARSLVALIGMTNERGFMAGDYFARNLHLQAWMTPGGRRLVDVATPDIETMLKVVEPGEEQPPVHYRPQRHIASFEIHSSLLATMGIDGPDDPGFFSPSFSDDVASAGFVLHYAALAENLFDSTHPIDAIAREDIRQQNLAFGHRMHDLFRGRQGDAVIDEALREVRDDPAFDGLLSLPDPFPYVIMGAILPRPWRLTLPQIDSLLD